MVSRIMYCSRSVDSREDTWRIITQGVPHPVLFYMKMVPGNISILPIMKLDYKDKQMMYLLQKLVKNIIEMGVST